MLLTLQTVKDKVTGHETPTEKAQRVAKGTADSAAQTAKDVSGRAHDKASDIAQDAQDAYNRQHGDSAFQKACPLCSPHRICMSSGPVACLTHATCLAQLQCLYKWHINKQSTSSIYQNACPLT